MSPANLFLIPVAVAAHFNLIKLGFLVGVYLCFKAYKGERNARTKNRANLG